MFKKLILIMALILSSCLTPPKPIITPSVVSVERAALYTLKAEDVEIFTDGVFITKEVWNKVELNASRRDREIFLLRAELSKFE